CQVCGTGKLSLKLGRYGAFVGCSNYPECNYTRQLSSETNGDAEAAAANEPQSLGKDPHTDEEITLRSGRFGPYVQRGDGKEAKRASLPKGWTPASIDHEKALALLSLPRDIGAHPESGKMISSGIGRYGPFVLHEGTYANLESVEDVFSIGLNRAVSVLADKQSKGGGARGRGTPAALKTLGDHPDGGAITVRDGRYGPYVNWGKVNATLPKGKDADAVTLEEALVLIAEKAGKGGGTKAKAKAKPASSKPASSKTAAAKTTKAKTTKTAKATGTKAKAAGKIEKANE
ncbi:MAG TPA: topoisomerase C-terminal repeat-containing protein, partial [Mycoplana sp.]|nr:topoisomerase C-terminal repeat-containing protein [Mycoplana sp.]